MTKKQMIIFSIIIGIGAFLRMYRIDEYMAFLGDEGRDVLVVKRMIVDGKFTLLGPTTSVGLMHLGPAYYYFMVPFLLLTRLHPVGPAIMVALFSLATIWLIFEIGRKFFDTKAGAVAAFFYSISPLVITYSHSSWNPNILPFWGLLIIYSLLQVVINHKFRWLFVTGAALGIALQLHYIALIFVPIIFTTLVFEWKKISIAHWLKILIGMLVTYSPYILFELRHQFINTITIFSFVTRGGDAKSFAVTSYFDKFWDLTVRMYWRLFTLPSTDIAAIFGLLIIGVVLFLSLINSNNLKKKSLRLFVIWYVMGIGILSFYTGRVFDYYLMFLFPLPFMFFGIVISKISKVGVGKIAVLVVCTYLGYLQIVQTPIAKEPNRLMFQSKEIADFILDKANGQPYNFALMANMNSDHAYRYFLEIGGNSPVVIENPDIDPDRSSVVDQLFVVCEEVVCEPLGHPLWEIAGFGRAEIADRWNVGLFEVIKLVPYQEQITPDDTDDDVVKGYL